LKTCLFCAESIQDAAVICRHCSRAQNGTLPLVRTTPQTSPVTWLAAGIGAIVVVSLFARACFGPVP
jgi:hypothetical protein